MGWLLPPNVWIPECRLYCSSLTPKDCIAAQGHACSYFVVSTLRLEYSVPRGSFFTIRENRQDMTPIESLTCHIDEHNPTPEMGYATQERPRNSQGMAFFAIYSFDLSYQWGYGPCPVSTEVPTSCLTKRKTSIE